ncbi:MAG: protein kinase [Anaerolineae bacterium]|nr:protein kinase [Anaerolineae bacterium]
MDESTLQKLGPYKIIELLGRGGMSVVYRAYQPSMKREVAVKVLKTNLADEPDFMERFNREVEVISRLEHPHILPVIDYGESDNNVYLVMRLVRGGSLADRLKQGYLPPEEANRILYQVASALDYAHRQRVIHRDLKPANILLDQDSNIYLTDFGIAKILDADAGLTVTGQVMGTPAYISPEQGMGLQIDGRADVYALGLVLYEMLTGRGPFTSDRATALLLKHVYEPPPPPSVINPLLLKSFDEVVLKALTKEPDERYQTAPELAKAFERALRAAGPSAGKPTPKGGVVGTSTPMVPRPPSAPQSQVPMHTPVIPLEHLEAGPADVARRPEADFAIDVVEKPAPPVEAARPVVEAPPASQKRRRRPLLYLVGVLVIAGIVGAVLLAGGGGANGNAGTPGATASPAAGGGSEIEVFPTVETNIHEAASDDSAALSTVQPADRLIASGRSADGAWIWVRVVNTGREGWAKAADLNADPAALAGLPARSG